MNNKIKALEWINYAQSDFDVASHLYEIYRPLPMNTICWLCQQSVEKSYKAILAYHNASIPKLHDIKQIQRLTVKYEPSVFLNDKIADKMTVFAVESRYPDNVFDFADEDAKLGLKYAEQVLNQVKQVLGDTDKIQETEE